MRVWRELLGLNRGAVMNHFERFGLAAAIDLDVAALEARHRELALTHHPDRQAQADAKARIRALEETTALNDGLKTLKDPVRRALYLLKLNGVELERDEAGNGKLLPPGFLEQLLELREALEEARGDLAKVQTLAALIEGKRAAVLDSAFAALRALPDPTALQRATQALAQVRYFARFLEEVEAIEDEDLQ